VYALAVEPDGKIFIGGIFSQVNGLPRAGVARLRFDGSVDTTFAPGAGGSVFALALQTDGKLIIGGSKIARLNTNGTVDLTFNSPTNLLDGTTGSACAIGLQSDGRIIVGGYFTSLNGIPRNYIARLNTNGSVDTAFDAGIAVGPNYPLVACLAVLPQDKVAIGGSFSSVNGYSRPGLARLNADGSVDSAFRPAVSAPIGSVAVQGDGKTVVSWNFRELNSNPWPHVARLSADGSLDLTFTPGTGADNNVYCVAIQPDGKTLIGGNFYAFNGTNINGIARLNGDTSPTTNLQFMAANVYFGAYLDGTVSNAYRVEWTTNVNTPSLWTPLFNVSLQTNPQFILDPNPATGKRFYRAVQLSP
jgi:uncharacterized delta-60 repeat protein